MQDLWFAIVLAACLVAMGNWRAGIYAGLLLDCLRDPIRKLVDDQSVLITIGGAAVWGAVLVRMLIDHQSELRIFLQRYPTMRPMIVFLLLAIVPGALLSCALYHGGWKLAAIGSASYLAPLIGIAAGYFLATSEEEVYRVMKVYALLNAIMLVGVPLEYMDYDIPGLGGIQMDWVRYREGYTVDLIAGFYRSPDIMGLHAAHVVMFSALLFLRSRSATKFGWAGILIWATGCMLLSGRRKMVGIPVVFLAAYICLAWRRGLRHINRLVALGATCVLVVAGLFMFVSTDSISAEYTDYAGTIVTEGATRANDLVLKGSIATLQQVGVLGAGIGTATQGRHYLGAGERGKLRGWQEDGVSRLLMEFGVPGLIFVFISGCCLLISLWQSLKLVPPHTSVQMLQVGTLSIVFGDLASAIISHQQFSGDPVSGLLVTMFAGATLGAPRIYAASRARRARQPSPEPPRPHETLAGAV
ncbi:MAG: hypothetical protein U0992_19680 [Planctomycetaceae bacterium]